MGCCKNKVGQVGLERRTLQSLRGRKTSAEEKRGVVQTITAEFGNGRSNFEVEGWKVG